MEYRNYFQAESLSQDAIHGYIPFSSPADLFMHENATERDLIDSPWVQRLRQIHQLQTAWLVYPTAEHSRFQHVLGAMHLASRVWQRLSPSFFRVFSEHPERLGGSRLPSSAYIESLLRIAALLHDVGHGPFGHFFDSHYLSKYTAADGSPLTHESLGAEIIRAMFKDMIAGIRRNPNGLLESDEILDCEQVAYLIVRPHENEPGDRDRPAWLKMLRGLFCGLYTVDNMDFVLRDAYMSGYSRQAFDLDRLIHYSFFSEQGLTLDRKGLASLVQFLNVRGELFRTLYFHRKVRAVDIALKDLFQQSEGLLFPAGNPREHLDDYLHLTEWSLLGDVSAWDHSDNEAKRNIAPQWREFLDRKIQWRLLAEKTILFRPGEHSGGSIFTDAALLETALRNTLPRTLRDMNLRFDIARHFHRPGNSTESGRQNFLYDPTTDSVSNLESEDHYRSIPYSFRICRVYGTEDSHQREVADSLARLAKGETGDDLTNM